MSQPVNARREAPTTAETTQLEANKAVVAQAVAPVIDKGGLDAADALYASSIAADVKAWVAPFRSPFPDVHMTTVALIAEHDTVVGHFRCSGTDLGRWRGHEPTGRRFEDVDEVYWFTVVARRIAAWCALEDNQARLAQLGLDHEVDPKGAS